MRALALRQEILSRRALMKTGAGRGDLRAADKTNTTARNGVLSPADRSNLLANKRSSRAIFITKYHR
jgi:hypothetical protein